MKVKCEVISDVGLVRSNNEDMALLLGEKIRDSSLSITCDLEPDNRFSAIVADGMGGYENGEVASQLAIDSFDSFLTQLPVGLSLNDLIIKLKEWTREINQSIIESGNGSGMGCTLCGIFTYQNEPYVVNIGDSRTYRYRYDFLKQITTDHSERNRLGDESIPSNIIYNALGIPTAFIDVIKTKFVKNDKYIICSDGLSDMVDDDKIGAVMGSDHPTTRRLLDLAYQAGAKDNVTIIYLEILEM